MNEKVLNHSGAQVCLLALLGMGLLFIGLSTRSLWGSEGRWAEVAREMLSSGNYFLPTINGVVYFDKPLLSYWAILPFSLGGTVTETSARIPSAISGIGAVLAVFAIGRRLFGNIAGFTSALLLLTSVMFVLWARTASAEMLNLCMIWLALWIFLAGGCGSSTRHTLLAYTVGAVAAFCKGPVGPAVIFASIGLYSAAELSVDLIHTGFGWKAFGERFLWHFRWIVSWRGLLALLLGTAIFTALLLTPVGASGSWQSVQLMWKENILRFFRPFDHIESPYIYLKYIPLFFAPWTFFLLAMFCKVRQWDCGQPKRWAIITAMAIFTFFTASGSRRSYYILPILPALAILTGKAIADWLSRDHSPTNRAMELAAFSTSAVLILTGLGLLIGYFIPQLPRHYSQIILGVAAVAVAMVSIVFFKRKQHLKGFIVLLSLVFVIELWAFTVGMAAAEKNRTLKPFSQQVTSYIKDVDETKIALYQVDDSALVFYLARRPLANITKPEELSDFAVRTPGGFIIVNQSAFSALQHGTIRDRVIPVVVEKIATRKSDPLALFAIR